MIELSDAADVFLRWLGATEKGVACWDAGEGRWRVLGKIELDPVDAYELLEPGYVELQPGGPVGGRMLKITAAGRSYVDSRPVLTEWVRGVGHRDLTPPGFDRYVDTPPARERFEERREDDDA